MSDRELTKALSQISFVGLVALDEILAAGGERPGPAMGGDPAADRLHDPVEAFEVDEAAPARSTRRPSSSSAPGSASPKKGRVR